ncbi:hypothetical protein K3495_g7028, partial [Podosphaera aphanis]
MGKYGGTILTGRENFPLWQNNLKIELAAARLKQFLRPEACVMPVIPKNADPVKKVAVDFEIEEWEYK